MENLNQRYWRYVYVKSFLNSAKKKLIACLFVDLRVLYELLTWIRFCFYLQNNFRFITHLKYTFESVKNVEKLVEIYSIEDGYFTYFIQMKAFGKNSVDSFWKTNIIFLFWPSSARHLTLNFKVGSGLRKYFIACCYPS